MAAAYDILSQNDLLFNSESASPRLYYDLFPYTPLEDDTIEPLEPLFFPGMAELLADPLSPGTEPGGTWPIDDVTTVANSSTRYDQQWHSPSTSPNSTRRFSCCGLTISMLHDQLPDNEVHHCNNAAVATQPFRMLPATFRTNLPSYFGGADDMTIMAPLPSQNLEIAPTELNTSILPPEAEVLKVAQGRPQIHSDQEWEHQRKKLKRLYVDEDIPLREVKKTMKDEFESNTTIRQFEKKTAEWNLTNIKQPVKVAPMHKGDWLKTVEKKDKGRKVKADKNNRFIKKQETEATGNIPRTALTRSTPSILSCYTPSVGDSSSSEHSLGPLLQTMDYPLWNVEFSSKQISDGSTYQEFDSDQAITPKLTMGPPQMPGTGSTNRLDDIRQTWRHTQG